MSIDDFETSPHMRPTPGGDAMYRAGLTVGRREGQAEIARLTQERDASREAERLASAEWLRLRAENEKMKAVYEAALAWEDAPIDQFDASSNALDLAVRAARESQ